MDWKARLKQKAVLVADGAWGTEFQKRGLPAGDPPELWNASKPDRVLDLARAYVEAGADIILTNTFGGNRLKLEKAGLADRLEELNGLGTAISKRAAADRALVFASIGPTGEFLEPLGTRTRDEIIACFAEQIAACVAGGADGILVESVSDLGETTAAIEAARQACALPVVASMTFDPGEKGFATMMGVRPAQAARALDEAGADLVGANCGSGIEHVMLIAREMRPATHRPLWIKPNAGVPELVKGETVFRDTPEQMAARVPALVEAGANVIGGCCGTTPEHIRRIAAAVDEARDTARAVSAAVLQAL